ncbi:unnamed protein product [Sordaria macrospora k-hell]|uniref:WGS project CABT00000000 data, contig 2.16 n=1 Tax=Sordaria macrospora (strain ATCC MYA-333 / DSM 997 / K(L3346) / K-hell) TaxID=771870 RepID=F7VZS9_SORMK|nr:uncharacterized protein SMAC_03734 [Sordaria macrospora k-hell]CCC11028.1 unnamed protein product [Sordaria macrospora k-hell]
MFLPSIVLQLVIVACFPLLTTAQFTTSLVLDPNAELPLKLRNQNEDLDTTVTTTPMGPDKTHPPAKTLLAPPTTVIAA